ncbi:MAG: AAA family ATPase [Thermoguttaceae bacterium]
MMSKDGQLLAELASVRQEMMNRLAQVIVGQKEVLEEILVVLLAQGHLLLCGVPGLGKTLIVRTVAELLDLKFSRIQFTPDLMPSDITGIDILQENRERGIRELVFNPGPLLANIVLADEINRTPPKTQSALLEAMQERQVTVGGRPYQLGPPFFVLATQNPIEQEGTYPLPESQLDRFMMNVNIVYPESEGDEVEMVLRTTSLTGEKQEPVLDGTRLVAFQELVRRIPVSRVIAEYAVQIVRATRPESKSAPKTVRECVHWGAGPRAAQHLILAAKAYAGLRGEPTVSQEDVIRLIPSVLRHRIVLSYAAQAQGVAVEEVIKAVSSR